MVHAQLAQTAQGIFHVDAALHLPDQQGRDAVLRSLFAAQAVEQHRNAHFAEGFGLEPAGEGVPGGGHEPGVEGAAHVERDAAAGTGGFRQRGSLLHRSLFAADDQLTRTVVVADLDTAQSRSLFAALRKSLAVQVQHGGHAAVDAAGGIGHGFAAVGGQLDGLFRGEHPGCFQRGIFAEGKPGGVCGLYALFCQHCGHAAGKGHHAGLGVLGLPQNAVRVLEADAVQVKIQHGAVECGPEGGRCFVKFFAHAGVLRTLAGIQHGKFHAFCLHSVTSSSISSRTVYIRSSRPTLSPQKKRPSSTLPLTASISAWVMQ